MADLPKKLVYGRLNYEPNLFIGGGAISIPDKTALASKFVGVYDTDIKYFNIDGNDIECYLEINFEIENVAFQSTPVSSFIDVDGLCTKINGEAFRYSGIQTVDMPGVTIIDGYAFDNCINLLSVKMDNLISLGFRAFYNCNSMHTFASNSLQYIGTGSFFLCASLVNIDLSNILNITTNGLRGCIQLTSIDMPNLLSLDGYSLADLTQTTYINIPNCTSLGGSLNSYIFSNLGLGCVINVHHSLETNNAGSPDGDLQYAINNRQATVNYISP